MASGGEEGGIIQAGKLLTEGGDLVEQGTAFIEKAGQKLRECGDVLKDREGGPLIAASGRDIERGARHALDHRDPIGEGWFRISTGGQNLQRAGDFMSRNRYRHQIRDAGRQITIAGANILDRTNRFSQAGFWIETAGRGIHDKGRSGNDALLIQAGGLLQNIGQLFVQGGELIEEGNRIIGNVKDIMNSQGPLIIENGEWLREGDTIIHVPKPPEVPLGERFPTIEPLLPDLPDIAQKLPDPKDPSTYAEKWDYIDFGWNDENNLDEFNIMAELQSGTFGTVYAARRKSNNELIAIKKMFIPKSVERHRTFMLKREKRAGKMLKHHNICSLISAFNIGDWCHFVMEFCTNGDFFDQLSRDDTFTVEVIRFYSGELIMALKYMYGQGFVHRDLKPENLMLDYRMHLKVVDFGLSKHIDDFPGCCEESRYTQPHMHRVATYAGTLSYCAPEICDNHLYSTTFSSDMYSLGCVIFCFCTGDPPFGRLNDAYTEKMKKADVIQGRYKRMPAGTNPHLVDLYESLMKTKVEERIGYNSGYDEIIEHPFYTVLYAQMNFDTLINMNPPPFKSPPPSANPANPGGDQLVVPPSSAKTSSSLSGSRSDYKSTSSSPVGSVSGAYSLPRASGGHQQFFTPVSYYDPDSLHDMSGQVLHASGSAGTPRTPHLPRVTPEGGRVLEFAPPSATPGALQGPGCPPPSSSPQPTPTRGWSRSTDGASSPPPGSTQFGAISRQPGSLMPRSTTRWNLAERDASECMECSD